MCTRGTDRADSTDEHTRDIRPFVRRINRVIRRKYTAEEKIRIVLEGYKRKGTVHELCRREGIKPHSYYA